MTSGKLELQYTLLCDDVRIEIGNKVSVMGIFQGIYVEQLPVTIMKFGVLNHWVGEGVYDTEVRLLSPDKSDTLLNSQTAPVELEEGSFTDNVSFFVNTVFAEAGIYWLQVLANGIVISERPLHVNDVETARIAQESAENLEEISETIN